MKPTGDDMPDAREWAGKLHATFLHDETFNLAIPRTPYLVRELIKRCYLHAASVAREEKEARIRLANESLVGHDYNAARSHEALNLEEKFARLAQSLEGK